MKKIYSLFLILFCNIILVSCTKNREIKLENWYDFQSSDTIFTVNSNHIYYSSITVYKFIITIEGAKENVIEKIKSNPHYIGSYQSVDDHNTISGELLFSNNNYYFLYEDQNDYIFESLLLTIDFKSGLCYIPFPIAEAYHSSVAKVDSLEYFFSHYDYLRAVEFYARFDDYVQLDDEAEEIIIDVKKAKTEKKILVHFNFKDCKAFITEDQIKTCIYPYSE